MLAFVNYYWKCEECGEEKEAYHGSVFNVPMHCGKPMKTVKMNEERLKKRNISILSSIEIMHNLNLDTIISLVQQTFGGTKSQYHKMGKQKLLEYIKTRLKNE